MFPWWQDMNALTSISNWMQVISMVGAALTTVGILLLWLNGNKMISDLIQREQRASKKIKAVEKAAEQIRKELLATQQNQDIADQRRQLAEMDADALRKEMEHTRKRYSDAEGALKSRIDELKDIDITKSFGVSTTVGETKKSALDGQQAKMLAKLLHSGPKGELDIISVLDDMGSHAMAEEMKEIFDDQGWETKDIIQSAFSNPPSGLVLVIHSKQTAPSYAKFLQRTLTTIGLTVSAQVNNKYREWSISLIVGKFG